MSQAREDGNWAVGSFADTLSSAARFLLQHPVLLIFFRAIFVLFVKSRLSILFDLLGKSSERKPQDG